MNREKRANLAIGILMILLGAWLLAIRLFPKMNEWIDIENGWPLIVVGVGVFLLILGLLLRAPGMAVPAVIVGGIGGILFWQNLTQYWFSWNYAWALIPGFVGIGVILAKILGNNDSTAFRSGLTLILISAILFVGLYLFFGGEGTYQQYWPIMVILAGLWIFIKALLRKNKGKTKDIQ